MEESLKPTGNTRQLQDRLTIIFFLLPSFLLFVIFVIYPIAQSFYYSFFNWKGFGPAVEFINFDNYQDILTDKVFMIALKNGGIIIALSLLIQLPVSLLIALLVGNQHLPGRAFFRTVFFMPYIFSEVIAAIMWLGLYNPDPERGLLNAILMFFGALKPVPWLSNTDMVVACIFVVLTWKYFGFYMLLFMTGLQNIPSELNEAAQIDGATPLQIFFRITLPLLAGTIRTCVYLSVLGSLQQFILVWIMTKGGPVNASEMMATYMYRYGFVRFSLGYGAAVAIVMFAICLIFSIIYQRMTPQYDHLGGY